MLINVSYYAITYNFLFLSEKDRLPSKGGLSWVKSLLDLEQIMLSGQLTKEQWLYGKKKKPSVCWATYKCTILVWEVQDTWRLVDNL